MKSATPLYRLSIDRYATLKLKWPTEGRRKLLLRVAEEFWARDEKSLTLAIDNLNMEFSRPEDQYDELTDGPELGLLLRTDYSNEDAWQAFYARLQESEQELAEAAEEEQTTLGNVYNSTSATQKAQVDEDVDVDMEAEEDGEGEEEDEPSDIFKVINPHSPRERAVFEKISNLGALRLLNDVDIQQVSSPPPGIKRISPPNRLIDQGGWQEIYTGKSVWIYDAQSNSDQCVRVVSQAGASLYGTATGDSWRARVTHLCEIQMNICAGMKIDFGELDGWDYSERRRNLEEASAPIL